MNKRNPWAWVPTLYFAEGVPYVAVMTISLIMYKRLGLSNTDITLYTSWLYLPWVIKPLWSPFVDIIKTKRWWIITMQLLIGAALAGVAFTIPGPWWLQGSFDLLSHSHHLLVGFAGRNGRCLAGADAQHPVLMESGVLSDGRSFHRPVALPRLGLAKTVGRQ